MLYPRCSTRFLASTFVLALAAACNKADEGGDTKPEPEPTVVAAAEPTVVAAAEAQPLAGPEFLRLTETPPGMLKDQFGVWPIEFALDSPMYFLGAGKRVLVAYPESEIEPRVIELPGRLEVLGVFDFSLILFGKDPARCTEDEGGRKLYADPNAPPCASVYIVPTDGAHVQLLAAFDASDAVLVGDHVAGFADDHTLTTRGLGRGGEVRKVGFEGTRYSDLEVEVDRLMWTGLVGEGPEQRSVVYQSRAPYDKVEVALQLDQPVEVQMITNTAWLGDGFVYQLREPSGEKLYRRIGDQTDLLLTDLSPMTSLTHAEGAAWLIDETPGAEQLWKISPKVHRRITFETPPKFVQGTRWGLVWIEEHGAVSSFHRTGVAPDQIKKVPEMKAEVITQPSESDVGFAGAAKAP